jgi:hydrogenase maturation protease
MKTMVLGVGNPILRDDGVGLHVVEQLRTLLRDPNVAIDTAYTGGMNLLDLIRGYDKVILVDAIRQQNGRIGEVKRFILSDASTLHSANPHDVSLSEAICLAKQLGETQVPKEIIVVGIVVQNTLDFGEQLSEEVQDAVPTAVQMVLSELENN